MSTLDVASMQNYLHSSITSLNANKLRGLLAEIEFRAHLASCGFADRVSRGGWLFRSVGVGAFGHTNIAVFPETVEPGTPYPADGGFPAISPGLQTVGASLHSIGVASYFCTPRIGAANDTSTLTWWSQQLGIPNPAPFQQFPASALGGFSLRSKKYNFLKYKTDVAGIPLQKVAEEFSKEHIRVVFQNAAMQETSDIDGIFWGQNITYPLEIKEKTAAADKKLGEYFGLDLGPFVKLAFYAARRGNLNSIFVVREIEDVVTRSLKEWWFIRFEKLARFASWVMQGGGKGMGGGASAVVKVPKCEFSRLDAAALASL